MGEYFRVVNKTKEEFFEPSGLGTGVRRFIFTKNNDVCWAVTLLVASVEGDIADVLDDPNGIRGSWAGDDVVFAGDHVEWIDGEPNLYRRAGDEFRDITPT